MRKNVEDSLGDVAIADSFKVEKLTTTTVLIKPGKVWLKGLPFRMRGGDDHLVSGTILSLGIAPAGVSIADDSTGLGKIITFNDGATTPTGIYRIVLDAGEENITNVDDPFLKNVNLSESTGQKMRLNVRVNVVLESSQTETPIPYTNDTTDENLVNQIIITPTVSGNGELLSTTAASSSQGVDGRDVELTVLNDPGVGSGNPIPNGSSDQASFENGTLIDSNGSLYHINAIFNDTISTRAIIRIDKEVGQANPVITNGSPYTLIKRSVYATDSTNGNPLGKLFYPIATVDWNSVNGVVHDSRIVDLRTTISSEKDLQDVLDKKFSMELIGGGTKSFDSSTSLLTWSDDFFIINPYGLEQSITANTVAILDGGSLVYTLDFSSGGALERGNLGVTVSSAGISSTLSSVDLSTVRVGNIVEDSGGVLAEILTIDDVNDTITTSPGLANTGAATIYRDSFATTKAPKSVNSFTLAVRKGSNISIEVDDLNFISDFIEDRSAYLRSDSEVSWDGADLTFADDIILEIVNTETGAITTHTIASSNSPITFTNGEFLWVSVDRTTSEVLSVNLSGTTPLPAVDVLNKDNFVLFKRLDSGTTSEKFLYLPFTKQLIREGQSTNLGASGGGSGAVKVDFFDPISTTLPTGASVTIDGISGANGDLVLFSNLSSGNNKVYELGGVGSSITWTAKKSFNGSETPSDGDTSRILRGDGFQDQLAVFNGTNWKVNETARFFDGADYWELSSIKTSTLTDNTIASVFEVGVVGSENFIINYSISRSTSKETGELFVTSDGSSATVTRTNTYIGDVGVEFAADIFSGDLRLRYTTSSTGSNATMKYFTKRWSNTAGGPTGIPNYTAFTGSPIAAAGSVGEVQFHGASGNLDANSKFAWDDTKEAVSLNGLEITSLAGPVTINDNQISAADLFSYSAATYRLAIIEYSIERAGDFRVGRILVPNDGSIVSFSDDFVETSTVGVSLSATIVGGNVKIQYTSTSTGSTGNFKYSMRRWS